MGHGRRVGIFEDSEVVQKTVDGPSSFLDTLKAVQKKKNSPMVIFAGGEGLALWAA